jgi:deoxyribodipyrimidine photolyase-related protein
MEFFYRMMRKETGVLMRDGTPEGGQWNYDSENRKSFGKDGPRNVPIPPTFEPDPITDAVRKVVERTFPDHPGDLASFNWPVTREQALVALVAFIRERLSGFGAVQDAMWTTMPFGWHSLLSSSLNLKLLHPKEVIDAVERAYEHGQCSLPDAEGFIRQVLGWREFMRGVYFLDMPGLKSANHFGYTRPLPRWYWSGDTHMNCMRQAISQTLRFGYAHHIQRLMVTGMFGVTAELSPQAVCDWYLAVYVDAVEWVELPNTAGMALFANGGRFTSKPYIASGAYIKRMSNYCDGCRYKPDVKTGADACPMTTLYWNFVDKHERALANNPRTALMAKNIGRWSEASRAELGVEAQRMLSNLDML